MPTIKEISTYWIHLHINGPTASLVISFFLLITQSNSFLLITHQRPITGVSVTVGYLSGIKPGIRGPSMVTGGIIGLMGGFMYAYQNSCGRIMGFFPNDDEVAKFLKK
ncbi:unnamed protein product [Rhodiola kirilowii]